MRDPAPEWINDGHFVKLLVDLDTVRIEVHCPREDGKDDNAGEHCHHEGNIGCFVKDWMGEIGLEGNATGMPIVILGLVPIEWGWTMDEFWWKVTGYPDTWVIEARRKEIAEALGIKNHRSVPWQLTNLLNTTSFEDADQEVRDEIAAEWQRLQDEKERQRG